MCDSNTRVVMSPCRYGQGPCRALCFNLAHAVEQAARRVLTARYRLGMFQPPDKTTFASIGPEVIGSAEHKAAAVEAVEKGAPAMVGLVVPGPMDQQDEECVCRHGCCLHLVSCSVLVHIGAWCCRHSSAEEYCKRQQATDAAARQGWQATHCCCRTYGASAA
jgi:hypothetical protein